MRQLVLLTELYQFGVQVEYLDVGGGLGVDYDGSRDIQIPPLITVHKNM